MKVGKMIRACGCAVLLCAISSATLYAGEIGDVIHSYSYRLVPANPAPNAPFELRVVHDNSLALDSNDTTVVVDDNDIDVTAGFIFGSCPPLMPCPPELESTIPIPALPSGAYHMRIVDSDGSPPFDASIDFVVGNPPATAIPTLDPAKMAIFALLLILAGVVAARSTRRTIRR
jgi:hypothetical protein